MSTISRLSALPTFLRQQEFWGGTLNPRNHLSGHSKHQELRSATAAHRWGLESDDFTFTPLNPKRIAIVDVAQSILERGHWTLPSWRIEQHIAQLFHQTQNWHVESIDEAGGNLGFEVRAVHTSEAFHQALVTGRWQCEVSGDPVADVWASQPDAGEGSSAEREFLEQVLVPVLGFPLLDFLHLQRDLTSLGLDPIEYARQRADFVLETHRGLRLLIELDGDQHLQSSQVALDMKRDKALQQAGWVVWRVSTSQLADVPSLRRRLRALLDRRNGKPHWGIDQLLTVPRDRAIMTCVWGATVSARIQFLLLEALREGILPWDSPWELAIVEHDTDIVQAALADFTDWFGRLRELHGESKLHSIATIPTPRAATTHLVLDIAVTRPYQAIPDAPTPVAWTRPANQIAPTPKRKFASGMTLSAPPARELLNSFVRDFLRKDAMREGQYEILARILTGLDVVGLLPTGAGKSLTYQLAGLLLGGLTIYVSPLKSLLQDQHERLIELGIDLAQPISSALDATQRAQASALLKSGGVRFLLVAPERFLIESFRNDLNQFRVQFGEVCQVVVDECHCVSEWGHDFRPAYLSLSRIVKERTQRLNLAAPLVALTGTASSIVLADVQRELGIRGTESVVRAKRLDRDEIALSCIKLPQKEKHQTVRRLTSQFLHDHPDTSEGLLVFCRFAGGLDGVLGVSADILNVAGSDETRFFCGTDPKWDQYAAIWTKTKAAKLSRRQVMAHIPVWALAPDGNPRDWEDVKAEVQREYICGVPGAFRVMVATNAFGMGIDKPSVRQVIHFMAPQSPEAYYQEVGRAGRDRKPSTATLLFSDEDSGITDQLLSPEHSIDEARKAFKEFAKKSPYKGGDFIRTFYFHQNAFAGPEAEADHVVAVLRAIRAKLADSTSLTFTYTPEDNRRVGRPGVWNAEKNLEYAIVRLILLGVIKDYVKDYNGKTFELELVPEWKSCRDAAVRLGEYMGLQFQEYVRRYQIRLNGYGGSKIRDAETIEDIERVAATALVHYVYDQIERKRRQASRKMLELARKGVSNPDDFRHGLMLYLQVSEKFTNDLEALAKADDTLAWKKLLDLVESRDEISELHGACSRVLESYPTHPGLLCISAVTRLAPNADDLRFSEEELRAALRYAAEVYGLPEAKATGDAAVDFAGDIDLTLAEGLQAVFGVWLMHHGREQEAASRFFVRKQVRDYWLANVLKTVNQELPTVRGL